MKTDRLRDIIWRGLKVTPVVGCIFILAAAPLVLRRKGYVLGCLAVTLDMLPIICLIKAAIEVFTGDLIPDRPEMEPLVDDRLGMTLTTGPIPEWEPAPALSTFRDGCLRELTPESDWEGLVRPPLPLPAGKYYFLPLN